VADSLAEFIPEHEAILMANHGVVTYGKTLMDAFMKMETVEHFAQITLIVDHLGSASPIQKEKLAALLDARSRYAVNAA